MDGGRSPDGNTEWRPCRGPCHECPRYGTGSAVFPRPESVGAKSATVRRGESSSSRFRSGDLSPRNPASREPQPSSGGPECPAHRRSGAYPCSLPLRRSEEHTSELQSLMRTSYAVFCLKKKTTQNSS